MNKQNIIAAAGFVAAMGAGCLPERNEPSRPQVEPTPIEQPCETSLGNLIVDNNYRMAVTLRHAIVDAVCEGESALIIDGDQDGYGKSVDCDDANPSVHPGAAEICNGIDDDCDRVVDNVIPGTRGVSRWALDNDGDGYRAADSDLVESCENPGEGYVLSDEIGLGDCDDTDPTINPEASDYPATGTVDGIDQDCNGVTDGGFTQPLEGMPILNENIETTTGEVLDGVLGLLANFRFNAAGRNARLALGGDNFEEVRRGVCANPAVIRALSVPMIEVLAQQWASNIGEVQWLTRAELLEELDAAISYAQNYNGEAEQVYFDSLEDKDDFISRGPGETEDNDNRQMEARLHRTFAAGCSPEIAVDILTSLRGRFAELSEPIRFE